MPEMMFNGCICNYTSLNMDDILMGCSQEDEFLCCVRKACLSGNKEAYPVGMVKDEESICTISLPCCQTGLRVPRVLVLGEGRCLCCKGAAAFPFAGPVPEPVCAICFFRILPGPAGFMQPGPSPKEGAPPVVEMER